MELKDEFMFYHIGDKELIYTAIKEDDNYIVSWDNVIGENGLIFEAGSETYTKLSVKNAINKGMWIILEGDE
jgi:hypothetical protein